MREKLLSVIGARASKFVNKEVPSELIPFKGNFPLLPSYKSEEFYEAIRNNQFLEDISEDLQNIIIKGNRIAIMHEGFENYLLDRGFSKYDFIKMKNSEKSNFLIDWMNISCINFSQLKID